MTKRFMSGEDSHFWEKISGTPAANVYISIFNAIQEGIEIVDQAGWVQYINPAFSTITGLKKEDRIGKNIYEVVPHGPLVKVLETGHPVFGERMAMKDAGIDIIANTAPIYVDKIMVGAVVIFQDITEIKRLNAMVRESKNKIQDLHQKLSKVANAEYNFEDIVGRSYPIRQSIEIAERAAATESTVLLTGESGTGKELFAHSIHNASVRSNYPFIKVNCAAIPENLLESEFFGYEKGAFTGAARQKVGRFELAHGGTIFLDEIGDMPVPLQAILLRVLEHGEVVRVGGTESIYVDVRVIASTNRDLKKLVQEGKFREDLFYRVNVVNIEIPPLRQRQEDIFPLADHILKQTNRKLGKNVEGFTDQALESLNQYKWPGNVREMRNCIERAVIMAENTLLSERELISSLSLEQSAGLEGEEPVALDVMEREMVKRALKRFGKTVAGKKKASKALNISLRSLYNKIKKFEMN